eukprot:7048770-Ditylum_brightwellii.AAC.1
MASMMALPYQGYLDQFFHVFIYLKAYYNDVLVLDPIVPLIYKSRFICKDWSAAACGECKKEIPLNIPYP